LLTGLAFVAVAAVVTTACVPPPPDPPPPVSPTTTGVSHAVGTRQVAFVDTSRPTDAIDGYPGAPTRTLPTSIWYPSDGGGPFPLVVFAHGYAVTPSFYAPLLRRIAAAGYVVAAPTYPILSGQPAGPSETVGWDQLFPDTQFVTTQVLALSANGDPVIGGLVDPTRIAVAGHSDGALIAFGDGYTPFRLDPRVRAVAAFSANLDTGAMYQPNGRPLLHTLSDQDVYNPYPDAITWDRLWLQQPRNIVTLRNASHEGPFVDPSDPHFDLMTHVTIAWLDAELKGHPEALFFAGYDVAARPDLASME
jgi:hypothetical protein